METTRSDPSGFVRLKYDLEVLAWRDRTAAQESPSAHSDETWQLLAKLTCPVLVLRGEASSVLSPAVANTMVRHVLKDGHLVSIPLSGHSVQLDNPTATTAALMRFIS
jgi:pimeloyl-ACP methyl ester carboxylesterase